MQAVEARYDIREIFKGKPAATGVVRDLPFEPGHCSLGLSVGTDYVFFADEYGMVLLDTGSFATTSMDREIARRRLDELRQRARQPLR